MRHMKRGISLLFRVPRFRPFGANLPPLLPSFSGQKETTMAKKSAKTPKQASQSEDVLTDSPPRTPKQQSRSKPSPATKASGSWLPGLAAIAAVGVAVALLWEFPINPYKSHTPAAAATESQTEVVQAAPRVGKEEMDPRVFSELKRAQGEFLQGEFKKVGGLVFDCWRFCFVLC